MSNLKATQSNSDIHMLRKMKVCKVYNSAICYIRSFILVRFLLLFPFFLYGQEDIRQHSGTDPVEVSATLYINKIYNIDSVNETYQIDGYMYYSWIDERVVFSAEDSLVKTMIYENERAKELIKNDFWIPAFELINVQGSKQDPNIRIEIHRDHKIEYVERFFDTFSTNMDYQKFPFDSQTFKVEIEAFSYDQSQLIFTNSEIFPKLDNENLSGIISEDWKITNLKDAITTNSFEFSTNELETQKSYSRVIFRVEAERIYGYYLWQVLFPLMIIILSSFSIFWIKEFSAQVGVGFTLMLTVVAFNFYSASILPKLPYNTFIEYVIIVGYIFIFLGIIAVILHHRLTPSNKAKDKIKLLKHCRYGFPIAYALIMMILYIRKVL